MEWLWVLQETTNKPSANITNHLTILGWIVGQETLLDSPCSVVLQRTWPSFSAKLLTSRKLSLTSVARETREMVDTAPRAPHPIVCVDASRASRTFRAKLSVEDKENEWQKGKYFEGKAACCLWKGRIKGWNDRNHYRVKHFFFLIVISSQLW